ncbi:MAG: sugar phosphate isomerase/epimerase [Bacteroidota bacterium]
MKTIKGPAIFLAQFAGDEAPFNSFESICKWAASLGYKGVQVPTWDDRLFDLEKAATSMTYVDEMKGIAADAGVEITELSTHIQGQLVASHPAYDKMFDGFAPEAVQNNVKARTEWAIDQLMLGAKASQNFGHNAHVTFSGALAWPFMYPWPQRPSGLIEAAFEELGKRWTPILNAFDEAGVDACYELHPSEDLHDGVTYEKFLEVTNNHPRAMLMYDPSHFVLQQMDYLAFIDIYHEKIKMFHVKDAEFNPSGKSGVYGGYQSWVDRPGRFRSLGDGEIDFGQIFSKLSQYGFDGWAVMEWECAIKDSTQGAIEGAPFIADHIINVTGKAFDDFASTDSDEATNREILGLS